MNEKKFSFTPRFPKPGESVRGSKFHICFGGKGANQVIINLSDDFMTKNSKKYKFAGCHSC